MTALLIIVKGMLQRVLFAIFRLSFPAMAVTGKYIKKLKTLIAGADNILLVCHVNPDGDAVGSMLALYNWLHESGRNVSMLSPNYLQDFLLWMEGTENIQIYLRNRKKAARIIDAADLIFYLDFNHPSRLGGAEKLITGKNCRKVNIDHHVNPLIKADLVISEPSFCATSEIIYHLVSDMNGKVFSTPAFNEAIYVGIVTDTGNFEHGSYNGDTMRIIASLIDSGVDKERIFDRVYNNYSPGRMRLMGLALYSRLKLVEGLPVAYIWLTKEDLASSDYMKGDTEGFVNLPLSIKGITMAALFVEKDGFIKVSLRSKGDFSVNDFAIRYFNGGGHINAAGGEYYDSLENTIAFFEDCIIKSMPSNT
jgi:phosphoesterase RecJ-like protein